MATKNATYKIFNGTDWDTYYFQTSATQVGETSNLKFLHLDTHKVNGKAFTATDGITLYTNDIIIDGMQNELAGKSISDAIIYLKELAETVSGNYVNKNKIGVANGLAELDSSGKVPASQLPSYVDDIIEGYYVASNGNFMSYKASGGEISGESGKIYVDKDTNKTYRWAGGNDTKTNFVEISSSLALGETSSSAYAGDKGKANADAISVLQTTVSGLPTENTWRPIYVNGSKDGNVSNNYSVDFATMNSTNISISTQYNQGISAGRIMFDLGNTGVTAGTYNKVTVDAKGRVTSAQTVDYATKDQIRNVFMGSATPTGHKTGDIWVEYS